MIEEESKGQAKAKTKAKEYNILRDPCDRTSHPIKVGEHVCCPSWRYLSKHLGYQTRRPMVCSRKCFREIPSGATRNALQDLIKLVNRN